MVPDVAQSLQRWKDAQRQLDDAIQRYVIATKALNTSLSRTTVDPSVFEDAVVKIDQDCTVDSRVAKLYQTQVTLRRTRNKSRSCVPINKLPWEILLRILTISIHTIHTTQLLGPTSPSVLQQRMLLNTTHVCALWRKVITHTPSFWSTIYLKYGSDSRLTNMCNQAAVYLGRARNHPLTLQFDGPGAQSRSDIAKIHSRVRPHLENTTELRFFNIHSHEKAKDVLAFWLADGEPGSVEMLSIWTNTRTSGQITLSDLPLSQERIDSFLLPVKRLMLHKVCFEWNSVLFHDLVVLKLTDLDGAHSLRLPDIVNILAKCPKLRNLQLEYLNIVPGELDSSEPILLPELGFLGLHRVAPRGLCLLLPMLAALPTESGIRIDLHPGTSEAGIAVQTFLSRIGAHKLWVDSTRSPDGLAEYFSATPDLTHLILDLNSGPGDTLLDTLVQDVDGEMVPRCPQLQTMIVSGGSLQNDSVQRVIRVHPLIEKVRFFACFLEPFEEELMHWIKPLIKDVKSSSRAVWQ